MFGDSADKQEELRRMREKAYRQQLIHEIQSKQTLSSTVKKRSPQAEQQNETPLMEKSYQQSSEMEKKRDKYKEELRRQYEQDRKFKQKQKEEQKRREREEDEKIMRENEQLNRKYQLELEAQRLKSEKNNKNKAVAIEANAAALKQAMSNGAKRNQTDKLNINNTDSDPHKMSPNQASEHRDIQSANKRPSGTASTEKRGNYHNNYRQQEPEDYRNLYSRAVLNSVDNYYNNNYAPRSDPNVHPISVGGIRPFMSFKTELTRARLEIEQETRRYHQLNPHLKMPLLEPPARAYDYGLIGQSKSSTGLLEIRNIFKQADQRQFNFSTGHNNGLSLFNNHKYASTIDYSSSSGAKNIGHAAYMPKDSLDQMLGRSPHTAPHHQNLKSSIQKYGHTPGIPNDEELSHFYEFKL